MKKISQRFQAFPFIEWHPDIPQVKKISHEVKLHTTLASRHLAFYRNGKNNSLLETRGQTQKMLSIILTEAIIIFNRDALHRRDFKRVMP